MKATEQTSITAQQERFIVRYLSRGCSNEAVKYTKTFIQPNVSSLGLVFALVGLFAGTALGQSPEVPPLPQIIVSADVSGFIPFSQSFRMNYQSKLVGLPVEVGLTFGFPINQSLSSAVEIRYRRRKAVFLDNFQISQLEITPGVKAYLEKEHDKDLRLYGTFGLLLAQSTVSGTLLATHDGTTITSTDVSKVYYNLGLGFGLGLEYAVSSVSGLFGGIRIGVYLLDPVSKGGLGDAGGISLGLGYRYSFY
jgi:hypothetical protein